jgi:iron complex transport system ATP-binding protein
MARVKALGFVSQELQEDYTPFTEALDSVGSGYFGAIGTHDHLQPSIEQIARAREVMEMIDLYLVEYQKLRPLGKPSARRSK